MASPPHQLSSATDPVSLCKIPILLVPVHTATGSISKPIYSSYSDLIRRYQTLRGDELSRPLSTRSRTPTGGAELPSNPRLRFFPPSTGNSISVSKGSTTNHVHLEFCGQPPARHLYPLSLLRMAEFPLIVLGIAVDGGFDEQGKDRDQAQGFSLEEEGDMGVPTPSMSNLSISDVEPSQGGRPSRNGRRTPVPLSINPEQAFDKTIAALFPDTSPFPLVKRLLVVPDQLPVSPSSPRKSSASSRPAGKGSAAGRDKGYTRFAPPDGAEAWLGRVLGEVVGELLGELGEIATALETPAGMRTLSSTLLPSLTSTLPHPDLRQAMAPPRSTTPSEYPSRPSSSTPVGIPHSASLDHLNGMGISLTRALTPGGRPTSVQPPSQAPIPTSISPAPPPPPAASSNPFRRSTALTSPFTRTSSAASSSSVPSPAPVLPSGPTRYTNASLNGVAGGRLMKLLGDFYLLAGLYGDAIKCYEDGAERCRNVGDVLWEAAARDGRAVAGIGEAWEGRDGSNMAQPFPSSPIPVEILSHYLSALACLSRAPLPYPPTILSPSPQAASGSLSFPPPTGAGGSSLGTGEGLLAYLHTSLSLRVSHFVLLIWASSGWGSIALSSLMTHTLPRSFLPPLRGRQVRDAPARRDRQKSLALLSSTSGMTRQSIFAHAELAIAPHHRAMTKPEQLAVHTESVWLARWLDLPRKEAAITREVIKRLAMLVVEGREEARRAGGGSGAVSKRASPTSASALAEEHTSDAAAAVGLGLGLPVSAPSQNVAIRRKESTEGNSGIVALFERACEVLGIDLLSFADDPSAADHGRLEADRTGKISETRFGWPELQVEMLKEGIAVTEALPDHPSIIRLALSALNGLTAHLRPQSQIMLSKLYPQALATTRRRGMNIGLIPWWIPGKVVLSIEVASLPPNKLPIEHSREEITVKPGKKDPFLYNPRLKAAAGGKLVLVANEQVDIFVTLRNPFAFELEIQDLSILTSGAPFITSPLPLTLPAVSVQTIRVTGHSPVPGRLQIKGVSIRLPDGSSAEIYVPLIDTAEQQKRDRRKSRLDVDTGKVKRYGMEARFAALDKATKGDVDEPGGSDSGDKWLECQVVEELPLAWIKRTSLTHGTVMLYNGESSSIRITLENSSSVPIDFIKLTFEDSTAREAQAIIHEGELTSEQAYELEWDQLKRPVFTWQREQQDDAAAVDGKVLIAPGGRLTLNVRCLGKVGCTDGLVRIDYGCINSSRPGASAVDEVDSMQVASNGPKNTFYTRQISFPVLFTVYHMIECHSLDLIRLGDSSSDGASRPRNEPNGDVEARPGLMRSTSMSGSGDEALRLALLEENDHDHCLLSLDVRNVYGVPFEVTLRRKSDVGTEDTAVTCSRLVPPGATERMILPLSRLVIPQEVLSRPIPTLSERQYVVDKTKKSASTVQKERELFWYREKLLESISLAWVEPGSLRSGQFTLRDQYFPSTLLDILRKDAIDVRVSLPAEGPVRAMDFVDVVVEVVNHLERPFRPYIHFSPLPSSSTDTSWTSPHAHPSHAKTPVRPPSFVPNQQGSRNVLMDGLASAPLAVLDPGKKTYWNVRLTFLSSGSYGLRAAVEEISSPQATGEEADRNIWFSDVLRVHVA
ncbi:hypothetical protein IAU60_003264 [Kwoniella sp. DSM 27419]